VDHNPEISVSRITDVFQVHKRGRVTVIGVNPDGVTDYCRVEQCRDELLSILKKAHCVVARFDLSGIPFVASGVLGLLVSLRKSNIDVQIQNASEHVRDVIRATRLDKMLELIPPSAPG
jgi:anti-anti-sigma factor